MSDVRATIDAVWRIEAPRLVARLVRVTRDVGRAEELAQDAFVIALSRWPDEGVPRNPAAWLTTVAKRRAIDHLRRERAMFETEQVDGETAGDEFADAVENIDDDMLRLTFVACHPVLSQEGRVALSLRLLGGLTTAEIARAFLTTQAAIAQRIVRAKRTLAQARVPFEVPVGRERLGRLAAVLEAIYLIFNEGYAASAGDDVLRPQLVEDALRLGRMLAVLLPLESEVHGLVALMELHASRMGSRVNAAGEPILLADQDRSKWNRLLIGRGLRALAVAKDLGGSERTYALQAAIAACHARAPSVEQTDWRRIAGLYDLLVQRLQTPVVELNRGVAAGMAFGPEAGLAIVDALDAGGKLANYHLLPSVRADLLFKLGRFEAARAEFERAASLARNGRERTLLLGRAAACG